jgi:hypothetical protein
MRLEYQRPPVRVAVVGLGRSFFSSHYPVFKAHPALFKVVAACDIIKERRDMIAGDFPDCKMFRRFSDMLDERDIDLVDIATCSTDHVKHALMALERGHWTLLESPMALNIDDAQLLRGAATKAKNRLLVLQRGLFAPDFIPGTQNHIIAGNQPCADEKHGPHKGNKMLQNQAHYKQTKPQPDPAEHFFLLLAHLTMVQSFS